KEIHERRTGSRTDELYYGCFLHYRRSHSVCSFRPSQSNSFSSSRISSFWRISNVVKYRFSRTTWRIVYPAYFRRKLNSCREYITVFISYCYRDGRHCYLIRSIEEASEIKKGRAACKKVRDLF